VAHREKFASRDPYLRQKAAAIRLKFDRGSVENLMTTLGDWPLFPWHDWPFGSAASSAHCMSTSRSHTDFCNLIHS
jgi:hypothetical protein